MADGAWNTTASGKVMHEADAVFEGGGVKGVALVGAMLEVEAHGYTTWKNVAGTSAGAILAAYVACGHGAQDALKVIGSAPFATFEDYGWAGRIEGVYNLHHIHGLCHGEVFRQWMSAEVGGKTFGDVAPGSLKMIATDITQQKMLVLPDDLPGYRHPTTGKAIVPEEYPIADAVRMSMSIPYFFAPVSLTTADGKTECTIVDGGVLSNFPVWIFDTNPDTDPTRPTFGFKIEGGRGVGAGMDRVIADPRLGRRGGGADLPHRHLRLGHPVHVRLDDRAHVPMSGGRAGDDRLREGERGPGAGGEGRTRRGQEVDREFDLAKYRNTHGGTIS